MKEVSLEIDSLRSMLQVGRYYITMRRMHAWADPDHYQLLAR